jgi:hypothetical protein
MSDIVAEFGGPGDLLSYLRGGAYVPDVPQNAGVPTAPPISMLNLLGAVKIGAVVLDVVNGVFNAVDGDGNGSVDEGFSNFGVTFGSRSPTTINGQEIRRMVKRQNYVAFSLVSEQYIFSVNGPVSQTFIDRIELVTGTYTAVSATFTSSSTWTWTITPNGNTNVDGTIFYLP